MKFLAVDGDLNGEQRRYLPLTWLSSRFADSAYHEIRECLLALVAQPSPPRPTPPLSPQIFTI